MPAVCSVGYAKFIGTGTDFAWFAGLMEGEGYFGVESNGRGIRFSIGMTDQDIIVRVSALFPSVGHIYSQPCRHSDKIVYSWVVGRRDDVVAIMKMLYPFMGQRRQTKIDQCLELVS